MTANAAKTKATVEAPAAPADLLRLDLQLCFALYSSSNLVTRLYRPLLEPLGITYPQYLALMVLWESAPQTVGALGRRLSLDSGTLTPLFKRLEKAGLVARKRDPEDERRVLIDLTEAGRALHARAMAIPLSVLCQLPLSVDEVMTLKGMLNRLTEGLGEPGPCAPD
ncbi:MAG TPA: MarR family transcriptional regulator [Caulobacteraceae bacterium]|jgi:DNA-binding MarR family transcriptional regulator